MAKQKKAKKIFAIALAIILLNLLASFVVTKLVYDGIFARYDCEHTALQLQEELEVPSEEISFMSGENRLSGRIYDSEGDSLVVIVQGINSCCMDHIPEVKSFTESELDVFIFDMTGSCDSEGDSAVGFSQSVYDLNAAIDHIDKEYDYYDIFLFGHSRGGYAACLVLSEREDVDAVVAVNSPNSAMEAVISPVAEKIGFLAYGNYPMLWIYQSALFDAKTVSSSASEVIGETDVPVMIVHSRDDETVPIDGYSIISHKDEIKSESVEYLVLDGGHSSVLYSEDGQSANEELMKETIEFFDKFEERGGE